GPRILHGVGDLGRGAALQHKLEALGPHDLPGRPLVFSLPDRCNARYKGRAPRGRSAAQRRSKRWSRAARGYGAAEAGAHRNQQLLRIASVMGAVFMVSRSAKVATSVSTRWMFSAEPKNFIGSIRSSSVRKRSSTMARCGGAPGVSTRATALRVYSHSGWISN